MFEIKTRPECYCNTCVAERSTAQREYIEKRLSQHVPPRPKKGPAPFWLVWRSGGGCPTRKHDSEASAAQEAMRLAKLHPEETFYVLKSVSETTTQISFHVEAH